VEDWGVHDDPLDALRGAGTALLEPPDRFRGFRHARGRRDCRESRESRLGFVRSTDVLTLDPVDFSSARPIAGVQQKLAFLPPLARGTGGDRVRSRACLFDAGEAIGESLEVVFFGGRGPFRPTDAVVVEPVDLAPAERRRMEDALGAAHGRRARAEAYCLQKDCRAPAAGTVLRIAAEAEQKRFEVERRILHAARMIRDAGGLHPNTPSRSYYHSVVQWAVWTRRQGYDRARFQSAFLAHARENFARAGRPWSRSSADEVRALVHDRWRDVCHILSAAQTDRTLP
jgi:hypothetical protein